MNLTLVVAVAGTILTSTAFSQEKTLVGKWKYASVTMATMVIDLENYESGKNSIADQVKKEKGRQFDSASMTMIYNSMADVFRTATLEFTADGHTIFKTIHGDGDTTIQSDLYTADYLTQTLTITHSMDTKEKQSRISFGFEGPYLVLNVPEKETVFKLRVL